MTLPPDVMDFLVQAIASLLGALVGAFAAFELERQRQKRTERHHRIGRIRKALFVLMEQRSFVLNYSHQFLDGLRDDPDRDLKLLPTPPIAPEVRIDIEDLGFLLERDGYVLNRLANADLRFRSLLGWMAVRNEVHQRFQEQVQIFQRTANPPPDKEGFDDVRTFIGRMMELQLRDLTNSIFEIAELALSGNRKAESLLRDVAARDYPDDKLFKIVEMPPDKRDDDAELPALTATGNKTGKNR